MIWKSCAFKTIFNKHIKIKYICFFFHRFFIMSSISNKENQNTLNLQDKSMPSTSKQFVQGINSIIQKQTLDLFDKPNDESNEIEGVDFTIETIEDYIESCSEENETSYTTPNNPKLYLGNIDDFEYDEIETQNQQETGDEYYQKTSTDLVDFELQNTLYNIDSNNSDFLYPLCQQFNVKHHQLKYLTDTHLKVMIPKDQLGIMAEFGYKLSMWKKKHLKSVPTTNESNGYDNNCNESILNIISSNTILKSKINKKQLLNERDVKKLLELIKDHFLNNCNGRMTLSDMERLAEEIELYVEGEDKATYFKRFTTVQEDGTVTNKVSGKIPFKWSNRNKPKENTKRLCIQKEHTQIPVTSHIDDEEHQQAIKKNFQKATRVIPLKLIIKDWEASRGIRLNFIIENQQNPSIITQEWPTYLWPEGNILVTNK